MFFLLDKLQGTLCLFSFLGTSNIHVPKNIHPYIDKMHIHLVKLQCEVFSVHPSLDQSASFQAGQKQRATAAIKKNKQRRQTRKRNTTRTTQMLAAAQEISLAG